MTFHYRLFNPKLKKFTILDTLGSGGQAVVLKVTDAAPIQPTIYALKLFTNIYQHPISVPQLASINEEISIHTRLRHPHIVTIYDSCTHTEQPFILMEYLNGNNLRHHIKQNSFSLKQKFSFIESIASGLHYLHEHNIIHADIKPENIFITNNTQQYHATLGDFGISKQLETHNTSITHNGQGTDCYLSPELLKGQGRLSKRTDLYALAITIYELFTSHHPYTGDNKADFYKNLLNHHIPPLSHYTPQLPKEFDIFCQRALHLDPHQRYQTVEHMLTDFTHIYNILFPENITVTNHNTEDNSSLPTSSQTAISQEYLEQTTTNNSSVLDFDSLDTDPPSPPPTTSTTNNFDYDHIEKQEHIKPKATIGALEHSITYSKYSRGELSKEEYKQIVGTSAEKKMKKLGKPPRRPSVKERIRNKQALKKKKLSSEESKTSPITFDDYQKKLIDGLTSSSTYKQARKGNTQASSAFIEMYQAKYEELLLHCKKFRTDPQKICNYSLHKILWNLHDACPRDENITAELMDMYQNGKYGATPSRRAYLEFAAQSALNRGKWKEHDSFLEELTELKITQAHQQNDKAAEKYSNAVKELENTITSSSTYTEAINGNITAMYKLVELYKTKHLQHTIHYAAYRTALTQPPFRKGDPEADYAILYDPYTYNPKIDNSLIKEPKVVEWLSKLVYDHNELPAIHELIQIYEDGKYVDTNYTEILKLRKLLE